MSIEKIWLVPVDQKKINLFWPVDADDERFFYIGRPARPGCKCYERGQLLVLFVLEGDQPVADVIEQLVRIGHADMNGGVDAYRATAGTGRAQDDASGPGDQAFTGGKGGFAFRQIGAGEGIEAICSQSLL